VKILSIDDSMIIRKIIRSLVDTIGLEFLEAPNGQEALNLLESTYQEVGLIILDWNMPVMDGYTTLQELKSDSRFVDIPVIMVTTENEKMNIIKAVQAGAKQYLSKPFNQEDLLVKMMQCIGMEA